MTVPENLLDGLSLPFSVPLEPNQGSFSMTIPAQFRNNNSPQTIRIPAGVSLIRLTWNGPESLRYRVNRTVNGQTITSPWKVVISSASEITPRSAPPIEVALTNPGVLWVQLGGTASQETVAGGCRSERPSSPPAGHPFSPGGGRMTTPQDPLDGIDLPYTVTFYPATSVLMYPNVGQRGDWPHNYQKHRIGPGAYLLQVTYYSLGADLNLRTERPGVSGLPSIYQFPAGVSGWMTSPPVQVSIPEGSEMFLRLQSSGGFGPNTTGVTAALTVYPMSTYQP